ncbi:MAG: OmpW family outer membrane protein [Candidatus Zixiibacteriota bacterium]
MVKHLLVVTTLLLLAASAAFAQESEDEAVPSLAGKHQAGARLGAWISSGEDIPSYLEDTVNLVILETDIKSGAFYAELFYAYSILPQALIELSLGIVNRGSVNIQVGSQQDLGNLIVYPILLQLKYYPLASKGVKFQPYISGGGGIYHGRQDVQFTTSSLYYYDLYEDTETDINYALGGGLDWLINDKLAFEMNFKYMPIDFSNSLVTARDYKATVVTVGVKYLYGGKK